jgi:hypothetical protein
MFSNPNETSPSLPLLPKATLLERKKLCITIEDLRARTTKNSLQRSDFLTHFCQAAYGLPCNKYVIVDTFASCRFKVLLPFTFEICLCNLCFLAFCALHF